MDKSRLEHEARQAYDQFAAWPGTDGNIAALLAAPPPPRKWFVRDRLIAGRGHLLTGIGGASKSTVLYHLGIGAVLGRLPWSWKVEHTGTALLFLTEDVADDVHEMLTTMTTALGLSEIERKKLAAKLRVWPLAGEDARLLSLDGQSIFENSRGLGLIERCRQFDDVAFIGLDPALGLTEGDENNQAHQRFLGQYADKLAIASGACTVLVSHATKASAMMDEITSHTSRGGGGITDAVRGEFAMRTMTAKEARVYGIGDLAERKRLVQLVATKGNRLPPEAYLPTWLRRGNGGTLSSAELAVVESRDTSRPTTTDHRILEVLREMCTTAVPSMTEWRDECTSRGLITGRSPHATKKALERVRDRLLEAALIQPAMRGAYVPTDSHEGGDV
jgi:hypothetical protein